MWAFVLNEVKHERSLTVQAARNDAMNLATAFEAYVNSSIRLIDIMLLDLRSDIYRNQDFAGLVAEEIQNYGDFIAQVAFIDRCGKLAFSNLEPVSEKIDLSDREHFRVHRSRPEEDRLFVSKPVLGRVSKEWTIQFTRPVHHGGEFAGVLVISVYASYFSDYYQQIDVGANGSVALIGIDRSIRAIASGNSVPGRYGRFKVPLDKPYFDPAAPAHGFYEGRSAIDGGDRLVAYRRLPSYGVVVVISLSPEDFMSSFSERKKLLMAAAIFISALLAVVALSAFMIIVKSMRAAADLRAAYDKLAKLANTDMLTGIRSRRALLQGLETELARAKRHKQSLTFLTLDIDHFKRVNDLYGHPVGDQALVSFANTCTKLLRAHDLFGRLGGEEFAIVLPHTDVAGAYCVAQKIRGAVEQSPFMTTSGIIHITVSIGVAGMYLEADNVNCLIARADRALYEAKEGGRNQVRTDPAFAGDSVQEQH